MTIPLDPRFIPAFSIEDVLLDKDTGAPLAGGLVYFEYDNQRGLLKPVYQITGNSPDYTFTQLPNPVTLSSIGTFADALDNPVIPYFYPYDADGDVELYYIRVTNSEDVEQFVREAQPYISPQEDGELLSVITNEISNPQFAEVLFDTNVDPVTYNVNAVTDEVINIAPDWDLIVSAPAAGTVTVAQLTPTGSLNVITNPGTLLTLSSTGLTKLHLRQRIYGSPNLWGTGYLSASFVAKTYSGTTVTLNMYYSQSNGTVVDQLLVAGELAASGAYGAFPGSALIPPSNSVGTFPSAYIDIYFDIPLSIEIDITSVMVAFTGETSIDEISYDQESWARQIDHLFHYYKDPIFFKPIPSLLTAWDFPLNPAQISTASVTMNTTAAYIWDQTIGKSVVGNIAVIRNTVTGGFQATTANANEAFYQLQYLSGGQARKFLDTTLSVNINAFRTQAGGACTVKVYLYRGSSAATVPVLPISLGTIDASGNFTLTAANWTLIPRGDRGQALGTLSAIDTADYSTLNDVIDLQFSGWQITDETEISDTDKVAIVVTYSCPTTATVITVDSIGLVPGDIPTRPAPQTTDEVLRECQYYYEISDDNSTTLMMESLCQPSAGRTSSFASPFEIIYNVEKRAVPTFTVQSLALTADNVSAILYYSKLTTHIFTTSGPTNKALASFWSTPIVGLKSLYALPKAGGGGLVTTLINVTDSTGDTSFAYSSAAIQFYYILDSRLGVV